MFAIPRFAPRSIRTLAFLGLLGLGAGCDRSPPEPSSPSERADAKNQDTDPVSAPAVAQPSPACLVPLSAAPPPSQQSVTQCPVDPDGRPTMPVGKLRFGEAPGAPELDVELARTTDDRAHGLMFRPTLSDQEGMLFSWDHSAPRSFWMRNTCLTLDMLFLDSEGRIVGVLENVPPWNEAPRSVACPATHVLEVRAGWTRQHGVEPGQKVEIQANVAAPE